MRNTRFLVCRRTTVTMLLLAFGAACTPRDPSKPQASSAPPIAAGQAIAEEPIAATENRQTTPSEPPLAAGSAAPLAFDESAPAVPLVMIEFHSDRAERRLLAWQFATGNVFRYQVDVVEKLGPEPDSGLNERGFIVRWEVADVSPEGQTTLAMSLERVRFNLQRPHCAYDSADLESELTTALSVRSDPAAMQELALAHRLLHTEVLVEISSQGEASHLTGLHSELSHVRLLPDDFPLLPAEPVGPLDSWGVSRSPAGNPLTTCFFSKQQPGGVRSVAVVECGPAKRDAGANSSNQADAPRTIARFDMDEGRFLSSVTIQGGCEVRRRLLSSKSTAIFTKFRMHEPIER